MNKAPRSSALIYLAFFCSGAAGLIYQVAWSRYLGLLLGGSGAAHVIVLSTFMGGLGLGAWLLGGYADRVKSPLALFVGLEVAIAAYAAAFPFVFDGVRAVFLATARGMEPGGVAVTALKVAFAVATILLPTALMGGTLPVLGKYLVDRLSAVGNTVAHLYYINSFGAVAGSLIAGFFLIGSLGLTMAMLFGAALDLLTAVLVWGQRGSEEAPSAAPAPSAAADADSVVDSDAAPDAEAEIYPAHIGRIALAVIAVSGAVSMFYEVAWIRMLSLVIGSSTYSFSHMVAAFLYGITLGSFLLSLKRTDRDYYPLLGYFEVLIGLSLLFSLPLYMQLPYLFNQLQGMLQRTPSSFAFYQAMKFAIVFSVMVLPTIFIGMTLPAASKIATRELGSLGRMVGGTFALNTAGTLVGAAMAGVVLMPYLGIKGTLFVGAGLNVVLGIVVLATAPPTELLKQRKAAITLVVVNTIFGFALAQNNWNDRVLLRSVFRQRTSFTSREDYEKFLNAHVVLYHRDGLDATIAVFEAGNQDRSLTINGKPDASVSSNLLTAYDGDMPTQFLLAHLPMLLHEEPRDVLVVGQGSGVSVGAAAAYPGAYVDVVELSPEIVETAEYFEPQNKYFREMPNVRRITEDARTFLALTPKSYDIIITEPSNPWTVGNASLFTQEFFAACDEHLKPGGLMLQWVHSYEMTDDSIRQILRTFRARFPYLSLWETRPGDNAILGSRQPFDFPAERLLERLQLTNVGRDMRLIGADIPQALLEMQFFNTMSSGRDFVGDGPMNSEFHPILEYGAPLGFFLGRPAEIVIRLDRRGDPMGRATLWSGQAESLGVLPALTEASSRRWHRAFLAAQEGSREPHRAQAVLRLWREAYPDDLLARFHEIRTDPLLSERERLAKLRTQEFAGLSGGGEYQTYLMPAHEQYLSEHESMLVLNDDWDSWLAWTDFLLRIEHPFAWRIWRLRGLVFERRGNDRAAVEAYEKALQVGSQDIPKISATGQRDVERRRARALARSVPREQLPRVVDDFGPRVDALTRDLLETWKATNADDRD